MNLELDTAYGSTDHKHRSLLGLFRRFELLLLQGQMYQRLAVTSVDLVEAMSAAVVLVAWSCVNLRLERVLWPRQLMHVAVVANERRRRSSGVVTFPFTCSPLLVSGAHRVHRVQSQRQPEERRRAMTLIWSQEELAVDGEVGTVGAEDRDVVQSESIPARVFLDERESCCATTELGSDRSDGCDGRRGGCRAASRPPGLQAWRCAGTPRRRCLPG